jgi:diketogulonate reductase-like aldo/keto reductase
MRCKTLGATGVSIPEIGLGTWKYRGGVKPLQAGIDQGAAFIDTAEIYGTEDTVREAIQGRRDRVFVATKVAPRNYRRQDLAKALDNSLRRLGTDYVDLYQLHWPNYTVPIGEPISAMEDLVKEGKIRFIGVSNFSEAELERAQAACSHCRIVSNQVKYSLIDRTVERGLLKYSQDHSITLIAYSPLGHGLASIETADPGRALNKVARTRGKTEAQVALNWLIRQQNVVAIPKASSEAHAIENCEGSGWSLGESDRALLESQILCRRQSWIASSLRRWKRVAAQSLGRQL